MPTYRFVCPECRSITEVIASIKERPEWVECDKCGTESGRDYRGEKAATNYHPTKGRGK